MLLTGQKTVDNPCPSSRSHFTFIDGRERGARKTIIRCRIQEAYDRGKKSCMLLPGYRDSDVAAAVQTCSARQPTRYYYSNSLDLAGQRLKTEREREAGRQGTQSRRCSNSVTCPTCQGEGRKTRCRSKNGFSSGPMIFSLSPAVYHLSFRTSLLPALHCISLLLNPACR